MAYNQNLDLYHKATLERVLDFIKILNNDILSFYSLFINIPSNDHKYNSRRRVVLTLFDEHFYIINKLYQINNVHHI